MVRVLKLSGYYCGLTHFVVVCTIKLRKIFFYDSEQKTVCIFRITKHTNKQTKLKSLKGGWCSFEMYLFIFHGINLQNKVLQNKNCIGQITAKYLQRVKHMPELLTIEIQVV